MTALLFFQSTAVFSQSEHLLDFYFEKDSIAVEQGKTFTNFLILQNTTPEEVRITNLFPSQNYPGAILVPPQSFSLKGNEKKRFPIKFIVNIDFMKLESSEIKFDIDYIFDGKQQEQSAIFSVIKKTETQVAVYPFARENYINPSDTETTVSVYVENRSYSKRSLKVNFQSYSEKLKITPKEQYILLEGQEKKLVEVNVALKYRNDFYPDYNIQIEVMDLMNNEKVGSTNLQVIALTHSRQVIRGTGSQYGKNFVEASYSEASSGQNYVQFRGNTEFSAGKEMRASINLSGDFFLQENKYNLYDTWVELQRKDTHFRAGNMYVSDYDYSISGRGAKVNTSVGANKNIELFALENNYSLIGNYFPEDKGALVVGGKYSFGSLYGSKGKISYILDHNSRLQTQSHLAHAETSFQIGSIHNFMAEAGISHEKGLFYNDENMGSSLAFNYNSHLGRWDFQSSNSFSSKHYVGLNRGSFNLNQNIGYNLAPQKQIFINYQNSEIDPEYLLFQTSYQGSNYPQFRPNYYFSSQSAQIGYQFVLLNWNVLLAPKVEKQKNTANFNSNELFAYRLQSNLRNSFGKHSINLAMEYSYSKSDYIVDWFHSFKTNISYRYGNFSLHGNFQANPNTVLDLNRSNFNQTGFYSYNVYGAYNFKSPSHAFMGSLSMGTNYSELYKNRNQNINGNLEYRISTSWSATGYGNYSYYSSTHRYGFSGDNYQFKVGLKKYFAPATTPGNHRVKLQLFEDNNGNGKLDPTENILANRSVKLDDYIAVTDKHGKVIFQNVPKGEYTLKINEDAGSKLAMDPRIFIDRNIKMEVGVIKIQRITGNLTEIKQAYDALDSDVRGIIVYAKDGEGQIKTTVVNQNEQFEFFLKDGIYDIYIENEKFHFHNPVQKVEIKSGKLIEALLFEYSKKDTTIKVKKF